MKKLKQLSQDELQKVVTSQTAEYLWVTADEIKKWFENGYIIGNEEFAVVAIPITANTLATNTAKMATGSYANPNALVVLAIGKVDAYLKLASKVRSIISTQTQIMLLLPVKQEINFAPVFDMGFVLRFIRPLNNLRPFYIFTLSIDLKNNYNIEKTVYKEDTYLVSKCLEQGLVAVAQKDNSLLFAEN